MIGTIVLCLTDFKYSSQKNYLRVELLIQFFVRCCIFKYVHLARIRMYTIKDVNCSEEYIIIHLL